METDIWDTYGGEVVLVYGHKTATKPDSLFPAGCISRDVDVPCSNEFLSLTCLQLVDCEALQEHASTAATSNVPNKSGRPQVKHSFVRQANPAPIVNQQPNTNNINAALASAVAMNQQQHQANAPTGQPMMPPGSPTAGLRNSQKGPPASIPVARPKRLSESQVSKPTKFTNSNFLDDDLKAPTGEFEEEAGFMSNVPLPTPALSAASAELVIRASGRPSIWLARYGKSWAQDIFSIYHNAGRTLIRDMYVVLDWTIYYYQGPSTPKPLVQFYTFYDYFSTFLLRLIKMDEDIVLDWVQTRIDLMGDMEADQRHLVKRRVSEGILRIRTRRQDFLEATDVDNVKSFLRREVDELASQLIVYFNTEATLSKPVGQYFAERDKPAIDKAMTRYFLKGRNGTLNVVLLTNWIKTQDSLKALNEWKYDVLGPQKFPQYAIWEKQYAKYENIVLRCKGINPKQNNLF
eukprot:CAMPEP_0184691804 /NCGR_PEP_ID=MMETSP0313-20130426/535_1 /TAXON_ID=2792 /ORGANISM="Porphyridium aerugineum, Strain SAG 1380-2" /LENGTH=461 /DNA_ID=CAMNT_0027149569 /DNA_START=49 /DNA_END=1434 /DNA_ORIENTATION=+